MNIAFLLLGGNLGNRERTLEKACNLLESEAGKIAKRSAIYQTAAWGVTNQPDFLNLVLEVQTKLSAEKLLETALDIEQRLGRQRWEKWHARTLDIDILYYNHQIIDTADLQIPHPEIINRRFTLMPLAEVAPHYKHPIHKKNSLELLRNCPDTLPVRPYKAERAVRP